MRLKLKYKLTKLGAKLGEKACILLWFVFLFALVALYKMGG